MCISYIVLLYVNKCTVDSICITKELLIKHGWLGNPRTKWRL